MQDLRRVLRFLQSSSHLDDGREGAVFAKHDLIYERDFVDDGAGVVYQL